MKIVIAMCAGALITLAVQTFLHDASMREPRPAERTNKDGRDAAPAGVTPSASRPRALPDPGEDPAPENAQPPPSGPAASMYVTVMDRGYITSSEREAVSTRPWLMTSRAQNESFLFVVAEILGRDPAELKDLLDSPDKVYRLRQDGKAALAAMTAARENINNESERIADERIKSGRATLEAVPFNVPSASHIGEYYVTRPVPGNDSSIYVIRIMPGDDVQLDRQQARLLDAQANAAATIVDALRAIGHR